MFQHLVGVICKGIRFLSGRSPLAYTWAGVTEERSKAIERVRDLAMRGRSVNSIQSRLERDGLGGCLERREIEALVHEVKASLALLPRRPSRWLARSVGLVALGIGVWAVSLGAGVWVKPHPFGRISGWTAIVLGLVLIIRPGSSDTEV